MANPSFKQCRVTVVAPNSRFHVTIPAAIPLADVAADLLRLAGEETIEAGSTGGGWTLSRLGDGRLDLARTPIQLHILDGDQLFLTPREQAVAEVAYDDVADAVAAAARRRRLWTTEFGRWFALLGSAAAFLGALGVLLSAGPPWTPAAPIALGAAVALIVGAALAVRAGTGAAVRRAGRLLSVVALPYGAAGGLLVLGDRPLFEAAAPQLLLAGTSLLLVAVVGFVGVVAALEVFTAAGLVGLGLAAGGMLGMYVSAPVAAALVALATVLLLWALPWVLIRLSGLPAPAVPAGPEEIHTEFGSARTGGRAPVDAALVGRQFQRADVLLVGGLWAVALVVAVCGIVLTGAGGPLALGFVAVAAVTLLGRARAFTGLPHRLPLLLGGLVLLAILAGHLVAAAEPGTRASLWFAALAAAGIGALGYATVEPAPPSPYLSRLADLVEGLAVLALIPLAVGIAGGYSAIGGLVD